MEAAIKIAVTPAWVDELSSKFPPTGDLEWPDRIFVPAVCHHSAIVARLELAKLYSLGNKQKPTEELITVLCAHAPLAEEDDNIGLWTEHKYEFGIDLFLDTHGYECLVNYLSQLRGSWLNFAYNYD